VPVNERMNEGKNLSLQQKCYSWRRIFAFLRYGQKDCTLRHWNIEWQGNIAWWDNTTRSFQRPSSQTRTF
jgi:hypothetical protein